ncbi:MAG: 2-amino-4-hydroxy-6-hydroxymethyldihydropteridine diphosphokinase, partial [Gammaproteobacteria bacterium]|nr:2-amino-4-hydroxy-6-hydroxymethyldihydropteridine diphosphokinase [Gammaproteobacteria bacterium]
MTWVTLSLGSNQDAISNLTSCLDALLLNFTDLSLSSVFESEAVGFDGDNFLNMVVGINTDLELA